MGQSDTFILAYMLLITSYQLINITHHGINALTVDNQLVSARNDCFERIALEAMLPFEKAFLTEDTNSLKTCKEKCIHAGEKCQMISFGVHRRGNGTCQLSTEKYATSTGRPAGVIFDPDFDLYSRKANCFDLSDNTIPVLDGVTESGGDSGGYSSVSPTSTIQLSDRPMEATPLLVVNPTPTTSTLDDSSSSVPPSPPPTSAYTSITSQQPYKGSFSTMELNSTVVGDRLYFSHDLHPLYKYPMLYEHNYPAPNEEVYIPGGYASNAPEIEDHYRPSYANEDNMSPSPSVPPRPIFGLGYGNGYSYDQLDNYRPTTYRPNIYQSQADRDHPSSSRPGSYSGSNISNQPEGPSGYSSKPNFNEYTIRTTYYPRPEPNTNQMPNDHRPPTASPTSATVDDNYNNLPNYPHQPDYTNRPDYTIRPNTLHIGYDNAATSRPSPIDNNIPDYNSGHMDGTRYDYLQRNGTVIVTPNSHNDDKTIATFFNPEDYLSGSKKRPGGDESSYQTDQLKGCFRRVLAGKRIAPQWVRRTIACEHVEECMQECGREKRFMCEGFNYRLDLTGHGQGDCELIEIPLAQMDLYSSSNHHDANMLRHPDYDYYERDRTAPGICRQNICNDCFKTSLSSPPLYFKPGEWNDRPYHEEHYLPYPSNTALDHYRPSQSHDHQLPPPPSSEYNSNSYDFTSHSSRYFEHSPPSSHSSSGSGSDPIDRYDFIRPDIYNNYRPSHQNRWQSNPSSSGYDGRRYRPRLERDQNDKFRPPQPPGSDYSPYRPSLSHDLMGQSGPPNSYNSALPSPDPPTSHNYLDHDEPPLDNYKKSNKFVPYLIGSENNWGSYGGSYGDVYNYNKQSSYWGITDYHRKDPFDFNYFDLGGQRRVIPLQRPNTVFSYPGSSYSDYGSDGFRDKHDYRHQWTRRPGTDECSAKTGEGFRLHKTVVKYTYTVPTLTECEHLCSGQNGFTCHTYSYRYTQVGRDNCMLCDRPVNLLDYYVDIEPDRDYDIYSMADDLGACRKSSRIDEFDGGSSKSLSDPRNAQCFFRAIDSSRFFKSIVRDSLTVRTVGDCEMECIKSMKFTCRAFAFLYGQHRYASVIDNCQLSDWPVRDMDKNRHLIRDSTFDVFERASYGHGCEIQPIVDEKNKKSVCYLGYGSPAKLLSTAVKKVITVSSELACKKECIRFRETTSFKCFSFSYGSRTTSYNCEMSDHDQSELKLDVHYTHTNDRNYWLFAWNPFDWTCRDKVNTIGGKRANNDRRMDIFREPGDVAWRHYTVSGKACRRRSPCEKNLVSGFYSCEIEDGEIGSWDYCCKADHPCGYSQGFAYPWCFVGDKPDQWRKCSDRYFPANQTHTSGITPLPPSKGNNNRHSISSGDHHNGGYQHPPLPGGLQSLSDFAAARLWPVTYLYSEGPPNSTEFSNFVDCNKELC